MSNLKKKRLEKFFPDGRSVILPIDHGTAIPVPGLEKPGAVIKLLRPVVDGYVVNTGVAKAFRKELEGKGICLRTDCYKPASHGQEDYGSVPTCTVDDALELGADAVMNMLYLHHAREAGMVRDVGELVGQGMQMEVPLILEALPYGIGRAESYTPENIGFAVRMAAELGADVVKTAFPTGGSVDDFRKIVESSFVPVVVLGGAALHDDWALLELVAKAMAAGALGVAIGRNVWQHSNPLGIATALHAVVHDGASAEAALQLVER